MARVSAFKRTEIQGFRSAGHARKRRRGLASHRSSRD